MKKISRFHRKAFINEIHQARCPFLRFAASRNYSHVYRQYRTFLQICYVRCVIFLEILANLTEQNFHSYDSRIGNIRRSYEMFIASIHLVGKLLYGMNSSIKHAIRVEDGLAIYRVLSIWRTIDCSSTVAIFAKRVIPINILLPLYVFSLLCTSRATVYF